MSASLPVNPALPLWSDPARQQQFQHWLAPLTDRFGLQPATLTAAAADSGQRRYLRLQGAQQPFIIMDAPAATNVNDAFLRMARQMQDAALPGPEPLAHDLEHGFILLTDLGSTTLLTALQGDITVEDGFFDAHPGPRTDAWLRESLDLLLKWQQRIPTEGLVRYDRAFLQRELDIFTEWCVGAEHGVVWTAPQQAQWRGVCEALIGLALEQPFVAMHRDWMARNLMVLPDGQKLQGHSLAILDFQDTIAGPVGYDLISLLRDAYITWDEAQELDWAVRYWQAARAAGLPVHDDFGEFWRAAEWLGLQRHLKVMGIFCRLQHRDGKPIHIGEVPRFMAWANRVALRYGPLRPLIPLLETLGGAKLQQGYTF
ncbi:aminoglycoside phosphotransferase family protein [Amphibiibacter pelophylacis]|uniref:Phosphotransferase n=1 Tax=Amphibiibacter pelophylacis TaxID=1799477 RepID=A0ACC6NZJ3_9BURK